MKCLFGKNTGFTLMELVLAIAILAILVAVAIPNYDGLEAGAQDSAIQADIAVLGNAFSLSSVVNDSAGKSAVPAGTVVNELSNIEGDIVDPNSLKLYMINTSIAQYYKKLNKSLEDYLVDSANNVYYKGRFSKVSGGISARLESDMGTTVTAHALGGDAAATREGHSAVLYDGKMIVLGGYNGTWHPDCYSVELSTYTSTRNTLTGASIAGRAYHSAVMQNDNMIVFGGETSGGLVSECYSVNLKTLTVDTKTLSGDVITARRGHSAVVYNGKMIVFGGYDGAYLNDCYEVDLKTFEVTQRTLTGDAVSGRAWHTAVLYNGEIIVFGGFDGVSSTADCYSINLNTYRVTARSITGDAISARHGHTSVLCSGKMIVFGGNGGGNSCYAVNLSTYISAVKGLVGAPSAREKHSSIIYNGKMIVFGGNDGSYCSDCYEVQ